MSRRWRVAVIGAGIGRIHVEAYLANAQHYEVVVVCDTDAERARDVAATSGASAQTAFAAVLARADLELDVELMRPVVAAIAGYFVASGCQPDPPGLPTLRPFQRAQGEVALAWLRGLWPTP